MAVIPVFIAEAPDIEEAATAAIATGGVMYDNIAQYKMNRWLDISLNPLWTSAGARTTARKM